MDARKAVMDMMDGRSSDQRAVAQASSDAANDTERAPILTRAGKYRMMVDSVAWKDKTTGEMIVLPRIEKTKKNSYALVVRLAVIDGTPEVPKGSSTIVRIVIMPPKGATTKEDYDKVMSMAKPRLIALTGAKNIPIDAEWMYDNLTIDVEEKDGKAVITRNHKMLQEVYITFKDQPYVSTTGQARDGVGIEVFSVAKPDDKSITYPVDGKKSSVGTSQDRSGFGSSEGQTPASTAPAAAVNTGGDVDDGEDMPF